jgi:murein DD-endopeptidase MepM/ murein hydrolase activator NlpD
MLATALLGGLTGCHPDRGRPLHPERPPGVWYVVERGETLEQIAARAGVPVGDLLEINGLTRASDVQGGRLIYVLAGPAPAAAEGAGAASPTVAPAPASGAGAPPLARAALRPRGRAALSAPRFPAASVRLSPGAPAFEWPLESVAVGSVFGNRDGRLHEGIDLPAPIGTPVYAAGDGQVIYAGDGIRGYGNLIVVEHAGDLLTVYAHNSELLAREGDKVVTGQRIARVGQTGRASGPHLHFEVRAGQIPRDPLSYLPSPANNQPKPPKLRRLPSLPSLAEQPVSTAGGTP